MRETIKDGLAVAGFLLVCFGTILFIVTVLVFINNALGDEASAQPARLIGLCDGQVLAAMEEDQFPAGCDWIEPIHFQEEFL